jgi:hypothetical protein
MDRTDMAGKGVSVGLVMAVEVAGDGRVEVGLGPEPQAASRLMRRNKEKITKDFCIRSL